MYEDGKRLSDMCGATFGIPFNEPVAEIVERLRNSQWNFVFLLWLFDYDAWGQTDNSKLTQKITHSAFGPLYQLFLEFLTLFFRSMRIIWLRSHKLSVVLLSAKANTQCRLRIV